MESEENYMERLIRSAQYHTAPGSDELLKVQVRLEEILSGKDCSSRVSQKKLQHLKTGLTEVPAVTAATKDEPKENEREADGESKPDNKKLF